MNTIESIKIQSKIKSVMERLLSENGKSIDDFISANKLKRSRFKEEFNRLDTGLPFSAGTNFINFKLPKKLNKVIPITKEDIILLDSLISQYNEIHIDEIERIKANKERFRNKTKNEELEKLILDLVASTPGKTITGTSESVFGLGERQKLHHLKTGSIALSYTILNQIIDYFKLSPQSVEYKTLIKSSDRFRKVYDNAVVQYIYDELQWKRGLKSKDIVGMMRESRDAIYTSNDIKGFLTGDGTITNTTKYRIADLFFKGTDQYDEFLEICEITNGTEDNNLTKFIHSKVMIPHDIMYKDFIKVITPGHHNMNLILDTNLKTISNAGFKRFVKYVESILEGNEKDLNEFRKIIKEECGR